MCSHILFGANNKGDARSDHTSLEIPDTLTTKGALLVGVMNQLHPLKKEKRESSQHDPRRVARIPPPLPRVSRIPPPPTRVARNDLTGA